jgi:Ca2+-dependent lipid-binding protein
LPVHCASSHAPTAKTTTAPESTVTSASTATSSSASTPKVTLGRSEDLRRHSDGMESRETIANNHQFAPLHVSALPRNILKDGTTWLFEFFFSFFSLYIFIFFSFVAIFFFHFFRFFLFLLFLLF